MGQLCFFNTAKAWGGGEKWHFEISHYLYLRGHDVVVFAHNDSVLYQKLLKAGIPCQGIKLSNLSFLNPFKHLKIKKLLRKGNFQVIVMNLSRDVKIAGPSAKRVNIHRIIYRRGSAIPIKNSFLNRYLFKNIVSEVLANSKATKNTVLENNQNLFPQEKIKVIYNGIDIAETSNKEKPITDGYFVLANLGRLEYQKNQKFLVHLAAELKKRGLSFKLLIGGEGRLRKELEALITELDVEEQVLLSGFIEKPLAFINKADVFVLSSFWEGFGYVLAEAALCKKPIITFDVSSNPELVKHQETGYLVTMDDVQGFADKVIELYEDRDKCITMGQAGYSHIKENFDKKIQLEKIEDYLVNG